MKTETPNPGSYQALLAGCKCPVLDNSHGAGCGYRDDEGNPVFYISGICPIHARKEKD